MPATLPPAPCGRQAPGDQDGTAALPRPASRHREAATGAAARAERRALGAPASDTIAGMRIAQIAPPWISVPPPGYGGTEWVVQQLCDGLEAQATR